MSNTNTFIEIKPIKNKKEMPISLEEFFHVKVITPENIILHIENIENNELLLNLFQNIIPKIKINKINCFIIPLPLSDLEIYWTDYASSYIEYFYGSNVLDESYIYITIKLNNDLTININEDIEINHELNLAERQVIYNIFLEELPYNFTWNSKTSSLMKISYDQNIQQLQELVIEDTNIYPSTEIFIEAHLDKKIDTTYDINTFVDNPYETSNFADLWEEILECSDIIDSGFHISKLSNGKETFIIDFVLHSVTDLKVLKKILELKEISFEKFILKVIDISGIVNLNEINEINLNELN
jgi:hypothetical protein|uniref:Uncharacterized protein n=1 Tax=viral metagenome TaxID=1070528 RepID=A0A6C0ITU5_9ZZZZ